jgi:hypothetical protein
MKTYKYLALASVLALGLAGCSDFGDTNVNPESINEDNVPYAMVFSNAQHQALGSDWDMWRTGCIYCEQFTQQLVSLDWWPYYTRYEWSNDYSKSYWDTFDGDRGAMRDVTTCYDKWADNADMKIDYNIARVMRVYAFSKMTDLYGDIPYSQAGRPSKYPYPVYDSQESIYKSMLAELDSAQTNLGSGSAKMGNQDLYYNGDAASWKKFANSLMLRLAMRLVKVDQTTAKKYAAKALANGLMTSNSDNCKLAHSGGTTSNDSSEPFAKIHAHEDREFYLTDAFVNMLKGTNDPRISLIGTIAPSKDGKQYTDIQSNTGGVWTSHDYGDMTFASQKGLPSGGYNIVENSQYFVGKVDKAFNDSAYLANYGRYYSSPNRCTYADPTGVTFIVTYAQTEFLLAEAAYRGYISGSAKAYYDAGVKAAFEQYSQFPNAGSAISVAFPNGADAAAAAYLAANPFDNSKALEQINTQYYINSFGDPYEVFSNWRRSGYPVLSPAPMAKLDGECATASDGYSIPRRFRYPTSESQVNATNYGTAVSHMTNGDTFYSRVWWDAK